MAFGPPLLFFTMDPFPRWLTYSCRQTKDQTPFGYISPTKQPGMVELLSTKAVSGSWRSCLIAYDRDNNKDLYSYIYNPLR
mgnify:CR=1 FL=1